MIKWALLNILLAFTTGILAIISASKHKDLDLTPYEKRKVYLAKSISIYIGVISCLICLFGERPIGENILIVDKWSIILSLCLIGELLTNYFVDKKCHPKDYPNK